MGYTHNWNQEFINNTRDIRNLNLCLEIGSFEGLTSNYIIDNILNSDGKLICIDPLTDSYINDNLKEIDILNNNTVWKYFNKQYDRFIENTKHQGNRLELYRNLGSEVYPELIQKYAGQIDLIYIDGDHRASAVYIDAINSFKLCKSGGVIIFDDYGWNKDYAEESTSVGIDKFLVEYIDKYDILVKGTQVSIRKK